MLQVLHISNMLLKCHLAFMVITAHNHTDVTHDQHQKVNMDNRFQTTIIFCISAILLRMTKLKSEFIWKINNK